jgi:hypothetical protein
VGADFATIVTRAAILGDRQKRPKGQTASRVKDALDEVVRLFAVTPEAAMAAHTNLDPIKSAGLLI